MVGGHTRQLRFQRVHEGLAFQLEGVERRRGPHVVDLPPWIRRQDMSQGHIGRQPVGPHADGDDQIQSKQRQVGQVILRERLIAEVRMDQPDTPQQPAPQTESGQVGEHQFPHASDDHLLDSPAAGNHEPDLAPDLVG